MQRRYFLQGLMGATAALLWLPISAIAAIWNKAAFESTTLEGAEQGLAISKEKPSKDIVIVAPDKAENGAVVQIEITSNIPNTEALAIFVEKNPTALISNYMFSNGALPFVVTRIKMAETSDVKVVAKVGSEYFTASRRVEVLENGCG